MSLGPEQHLDDALSAYADGALAPTERHAAEAHLAACPPCRAELTATLEVRAWLRDLGPVDPPFGFYERLLRTGPDPRPHVRFGMANLAATAAAWLLVLGVLGARWGEPSVDPAVGQYVSAHASVLSLTPGSMPPDFDAGTDAAASYGVPDQLGTEYRLAGVRAADGTQAVYRDGREMVSLFVRAGHLDTSALPEGAEPIAVPGATAWRVVVAGEEVVYLQRDDVVVVLVAPSTEDAVAPAAAAAPEPSGSAPSLLDRLEGAGQGLLDTFSLWN
jgi:anti-sigma factor RsiW